MVKKSSSKYRNPQYAKTLICKNSKSKSETDYIRPGELGGSPIRLYPFKPPALKAKTLVSVDEGPELEIIAKNG